MNMRLLIGKLRGKVAVIDLYDTSDQGTATLWNNGTAQMLHLQVLLLHLMAWQTPIIQLLCLMPGAPYQAAHFRTFAVL